MVSSHFFSKIDLEQVHSKIRIHDEHVQRTAFETICSSVPVNYQKSGNAVNTTEILLLNIVNHHKISRDIVSGCNHKLALQWWPQFSSLLPFIESFTSAFHVNGLTECAN